MDVNLEYSTLTRLLTLNNRVHDMENRLLALSVPMGPPPLEFTAPAPGSNCVAALQEGIAQGVRASLTACWLGASED